MEESVAASNREAAEAWSGPLFDRFVKYRDLVAGGLGAHGEEAMRLNPPAPGERVLDLGCGFGDTTQRLAGLVGPEGEVIGLDVSEPFVAQARREADGVANVRFDCVDVQVGELGDGFDYAFSRMGLMFFASPVAALRNIRGALVPGGRLCAVVWRRKLDNEWVRRAELVVDRYLEHPEESEEPTCGPGPFSMADADTLTEQLQLAGFEEVSLRRCDLPLKIGDDLEHAVEFNMALGPAGEVLRLWGDRVEEIRPRIAAELREALAEFEGPDGVYAPASTWIVSARAGGGGESAAPSD
ncbi:MAG TPA: class I SAM-dependent methyltransferase [Solirubrobacterales bacterium]|nr:class I SAM-dependent methyltransferase [Solirubrobacterales bacterium]